MSRKTLRLKLISLLEEFESEHGLKEDEIGAIASITTAVVHSDMDIRRDFYDAVSVVAKKAVKLINREKDILMGKLDAAQRTYVIRKIKGLVSKSKIEN